MMCSYVKSLYLATFNLTNSIITMINIIEIDRLKDHICCTVNCFHASQLLVASGTIIILAYS